MSAISRSSGQRTTRSTSGSCTPTFNGLLRSMARVYRRPVGDTVRPMLAAAGLAPRPGGRHWLGGALLRLEPVERFIARALDPFDRLARSVDRDALPIERVESAQVRGRESQSDPLPDLSDFVTAHYARLIRLAGLITRNTDDAEDAVQAALERAWKRRAELRDQQLLKQWIDRIVVREASRISGSRVRRLARLVTGPADDEVEIDLPDPKAPPPAELAEMNAAFRRLSHDQRAVVSLHLYAGYSVAETAEMVGAPVETVRSRLRLARQRLRSELERGA